MNDGTERLERRVRRGLQALERRGLQRALRPPSGIDLCSNDYLGLSTHPLVAQRMIDAVRREGCGSTGSRLLRGERALFDAVERRFAAWKGAARALYFSSGYLANLAVLTTFVEPGDLLYSDAANHASLIDGMRLSQARRVILPHRDVGALAQALEADAGPGQRFLVTESLFSMDGDHAPLRDYAAICRDRQVTLIVDEAHAVGLYGDRGSGLLEACGIDADAVLSINTAGKALGVAGAFVAGPAWAIEYLIQRARPFIFSTAAPPPVLAALDASLTVIETEPGLRERLHARARYLRARLAAEGLDVPADGSQIVPIVIGSNARAVAVADALQQQGFDVRAIRPPTVPEGTARLRIAVNTGLTEAILDRFAAALAAALRHVDTCCAASS